MTVDQIELPELSPERQDEIERAVFARIDAERAGAATAAHRRRRNGWLVAGAAAAVVLVAGFLGPALSNSGVGFGVAGSAGSAEESSDAELWSHPDAPRDLADEDMDAGGGEGADAGGDDGAGGDAGQAAREVIARAYVSLTAEDPAAAADEVGTAAERAGGYVESMSVAGRTGTEPEAPAEGSDAPSSNGGSWITVRVPASDLTAFLDGLRAVGDVVSSEISRDDVTAQSTDLRARTEALQASVDRLQELIADAGSTADLLAAEGALADRQAELDSLRAQLEALDDQVALSSVEVAVSAPQETVVADPQGFEDGLSTGWNALVTTLNGIVIGLGFLLPWLVIAGVVVLVVRVARRAIRRRRAGRADTTG